MIQAAVDAHQATLEPVTNQIGLGGDSSYAVCGCPNSTKPYPKLPACTCNPENFAVWTCTSRDGRLHLNHPFADGVVSDVPLPPD